MKIFHLSTPTTWRGGEQQIAYLSVELQKQGIAQCIFTPQDSPLYLFAKEKGIETCIWQSKNKIKNALFLAEKTKKDSKIILHLHDSHAHTIAILATTFFGNRANMVLSRRVDFSLKSNYFSLYKYNHFRIKKILCVSQAIQKVVLPFIKDKQKVAVVYSGIDLSKMASRSNLDTTIEDFESEKNIRKSLNLSQDTFLIGKIAALAPHKDPLTFLETAKLLLQNEKFLAYTKGKVKFLLVGKPDGAESKIEDWLAQNSDLANFFALTGHRNDIATLLPQLDLFLFTSETEGLGTSILDAFAARVPVVATAAGGIPELVLHRQTGLLAPVKDTQKLAQYVLEILENPTQKQNLIENAWSHLQNFTKEKMASQTLAYYRQIDAIQ
ncbi:glycosyltransferase family 4 protein [Hugenholtzia roseola]|uniref:glycosyltransferase family 4 protein n=1 Tax=Hugenholtzia roseola TaxID=1002 RepID=UPI0003FCA4C6|nr:glycosyltransferase family 4 protein [Hugenholtzia roseola]